MVNFSCVVVCGFFFQNHLFFFYFYRNNIRVSNSLCPDQAPHFVEPDLGPNYLEMLSADGTNKQSKVGVVCGKVNCCLLAYQKMYSDKLYIANNMDPDQAAP